MDLDEKKQVVACIYEWGQSDVDPNANLYLVVWKAHIEILCSIDLSYSKFFGVSEQIGMFKWQPKSESEAEREREGLESLSQSIPPCIIP